MAPKKKTDVIPTTDHEQARKDFKQITQPAPLPTFDNFSMIMEAKRRARQLRDIQAKEKLTKELQRANDLKEREQSEPAKPGMVEFNGIMFSQSGKGKLAKLLDDLVIISIQDGKYVINAGGQAEAMRYAISIMMYAVKNNWVEEFFRKKKNGVEIKKWSYIINNFLYRVHGTNEACVFDSRELSETFNRNLYSKNDEESFDCTEMDYVGGFIH